MEIIREKAFFGVTGGSARHHDDDTVIVPPSGEQDHFDRHVVRAAGVLGLKVKVEESVSASDHIKLVKANMVKKNLNHSQIIPIQTGVVGGVVGDLHKQYKGTGNPTYPCLVVEGD